MNARSRSRAVGWVLGFCLAVLAGSLSGATTAGVEPVAVSPLLPPEPVNRAAGLGATPGPVDALAVNTAPTFVVPDGKVTTAFGGGDRGYSVALLPDGKLVAAGTSTDGGYYPNNDFALARYLPDGSLDTTFGTGGKVTTDFGGEDSARSVVLQPDGKLVVVGSSNKDFALARYLSDGGLDISFGIGGKVTTDLVGSDGGDSVALQSEGKLVLAGFTDEHPYSSDFALARYLPDGSLDNMFGPPQNTLAYQPNGYEHSANVITPKARILDTELAALGTYDGATLTIARQGGTNPQDIFSSSGGTLSVLNPGSYFAIDSVTIGQVLANSGGMLQLKFLGANATQARVDKTMQQIAYLNTSDTPPAQVLIDWTFDDGNTGAQGTGGALSTTGTVTVNITPINDPPQLVNPPATQTAGVGAAFSYTLPANTFADPDDDPLTYSFAMADGTGVPPWLSFNPATRTFSGTPGAGDGGTLQLNVTARDPSNASATANLTLRVTAVTATSGLHASVLPTARSVQIGQPATAFGTLINATGLDAWSCSLALPASPPIPATFNYQTTNASNQLLGTPNTPVDIPAGGSQSFVFGITPTAAFNATGIPLVFDCVNTQPAPSQIGLNTFLLSASSTPVPDMIAIGATPTGDGVLRIPGPTGIHAFATAAINIGGSGAITATVDTGGVTLPLHLTLCQTDPANGGCLSPPAASVSGPVNTQQAVTYAVFAQATGVIPFDPAGNRNFLRLTSGGVVRGATSVAVTTQ